MTAFTGYQAAVIDNSVYFDQDPVPDGNPAECDTNKYRDAGRAFRQWAGLEPKNNALVETGNPIRSFHFRLALHYKTPEQMAEICQPGDTACAFPDGCDVYLPKSASTYLFGHEVFHCIKGHYHGDADPCI